MTKEINYLIVAMLVVMVGGVIFYFGGKATLEAKQREEQENLADCLLEKNVKMYGSSNCLHTKRQKEIFGEALSKINYIECSEGEGWSKTCQDKGINAVPTWSFPKEMGIESRLLSCTECAKESGDIYCRDYCFEPSSDGKEFYVSGFTELKKLADLSGCQTNH
jgi:hypothetical protein